MPHRDACTEPEVGPPARDGRGIGRRARDDVIVQYCCSFESYRIGMQESGPRGDHRPCGLGRRLGALVYDGVVLVALWMLAAMVVVLPAGGSIDSGNPLFQLYLLAVAFGYLQLCWSRLGQTLGMRTWRIRLDCGDRRFTFARGLARFGGGLASIATLGLGFAWALGRRDRRAWPDLFSGTRLVVRPAR